ncbi:MAG: SMI1/KNR4 family protein [Actinomycetia bacterium]|nr:SMI1/KNR4 family protein [Actinomycetes bacterium]
MQETEITQLVRQIIAWLREHGPEYVQGPPNPGATEVELAVLQEHLGRPLPPALAAMLRVVNGDVYIGEYALLSAEHIASTWAGCKRFFDDGTFARFEPYDDGRDILKPGWWHPGLIPVLEDSCGNQLCTDLDPGPRGVAGQMVWWETRAGPYPHGADSLLALLHAHWKHLSSGKYDTPEAWDLAGCHELTQVERT